MLTSNKICQLKALIQNVEVQKKSTSKKDKSTHEKNRTRKDVIQKYNNNFIIPNYFGAWLSGFIEAEGSFISKKRPVFSICQNDDWYILNAIKTYYNSSHKISKSKVEQSISYKIQISNSKCLEKIIMHIESNPLLGNKQDAYKKFRELFYFNKKIRNMV